jgi:hypothetical protein
MTTTHKVFCSIIFAMVVCLVASGCVCTKATKKGDDEAKIVAKQCQDEKKLVDTHIATFDDLDYNVFTGQKWAEFHQSHSQDVLVHWPDSHTTKGIEKHIEDLKGMFVWAPDTRIKIHTVKIGQREWTAVIGIMEGTFTKPMPAADGKTIQPTNKPYKINMATIGHWNKDGVMDEEYLFWDNQEFMKEIGLGQ